MYRSRSCQKKAYGCFSFRCACNLTYETFAAMMPISKKGTWWASQPSFDIPQTTAFRLDNTEQPQFHSIRIRDCAGAYRTDARRCHLFTTHWASLIARCRSATCGSCFARGTSMRASSLTAWCTHVANKRSAVDASVHLFHSAELRQAPALHDRVSSGGSVPSSCHRPPHQCRPCRPFAPVDQLPYCYPRSSPPWRLPGAFRSSERYWSCCLVALNALRRALSPFLTLIELVEDAQPLERDIDYHAP